MKNTITWKIELHDDGENPINRYCKNVVMFVNGSRRMSQYYFESDCNAITAIRRLAHRLSFNPLFAEISDQLRDLSYSDEILWAR